MAIFGAKLWVKPLWKNVNFSIFWISLFYSQERCFFALEYRKRHFPDLYCLKKKVGKMAIFDSKPWVNPFGKMFWTSCFYSLARRFFVVECRKRHFFGLYCLKKNAARMANFGPKPWVNSFGKLSIFRLFELLVFIA